MGVTIQAESHRNELAGVYENEHDPETLEYFDQPPPIKLVYQAKSGQQVGVLHTPDYFVIRTDSLGWEEWKTEEELLQLLEKMPNRYARDEDGRWRCPPGERYAQQFGFFYRVRSSAEIDWVLQRNLLFMEDYLHADCRTVDEKSAEAILMLVTNMPGIHLDELVGQVKGWSSDDVYTMIANDRLYIDLRAAPLAEPERVRIFRDEETACAYAAMGKARCQSMASATRSVVLAAGTSVAWDGRRWTIANPGLTTTALLAEDGTIVELPNGTLEALIGQGKLVGAVELVQAGISGEARERLLRASPDDFREANRRHATIASFLSGGAAASGTTPARTVRHWLAKWREAEQVHNCGYVGLLPCLAQSGNHRRKLPEATLLLLGEFIAKDYETLKQKPKFEVYAALVRACEAKGITVPSYRTFTGAVNGRPRQEQIEKRQGKRAAYQVSAFFWELTFTTPRHGDRPFEIGHVDHTQLDVELVCSRTGRNLGRPWATFLTDSYSRRLLAVYLTFDPPSYRSCMMILRECVHRHRRLPQIVVVDGGAEFESVYFETLLARYECTKKTRPSAQPRFGSVCERLFGTTNTRFVHNLVGNTQLLQNVRQVTRSIDPKQHALWTLSRLYARLCEWAYEVYDTIEHPALGTTPREAFAAGLLQGGERPHRLIPYDEDFQMMTLPTTQKGTARLQPRLGVKINYVHYWSDAFLNPEVEGTQVPVRYDPFDMGVAYAFVKGRWVRCISQHHAQFAGRSEHEIQSASAELRRRNQRYSGQLTITARKLADFLSSLEAEEVLLEQRLRDAEARDVLKALATGPEFGRTPGEIASVTRAEGAALGEVARGAEETLDIYEDY
jgi:transposase InsO family protein